MTSDIHSNIAEDPILQNFETNLFKFIKDGNEDDLRDYLQSTNSRGKTRLESLDHNWILQNNDNKFNL